MGVFVALSAIAPRPRMFAAGAVVAIPIAALLAGVTEFLILDGVDQFPLLAIGMAPSVLGAALLFTLPNARISSGSFLVLSSSTSETKQGCHHAEPGYGTFRPSIARMVDPGRSAPVQSSRCTEFRWIVLRLSSLIEIS